MKAICKANYDYEDHLIVGKEYEITPEEGIFENRPFARFKSENGSTRSCHLSRFVNLDGTEIKYDRTNE